MGEIMSIQIKSLHKDNKIYKDISPIKYFKLEDVLVSSHHDVLENITDNMMYRLIILHENLSYIDNMVHDAFGLNVKCSSGLRTKKTNKLIGGSKSSQHLDGKALDLHFYLNDERIWEKSTIEMVFVFLADILDGQWIQMFIYDWGIHIGYADGIRYRIRRIKKRL